uniref:Uncharacterized protein n=1 Tax=Acrobeloides nanus TaxID=290746 RepID=A0A914CI38_9BILA
MECIEKMRTLIYELDKQIDLLEDSLKKANKLEDGEVMKISNPSVKIFKQELIEHIESEKAEKPQILKDRFPREEVDSLELIEGTRLIIEAIAKPKPNNES